MQTTSAYIRILLAILTCCVSLHTHGITLFSNRQTTYTIIVAESASPSEKTAAKELQEYLRQISGTTFSISNDTRHSNGNHIYIGYNSRVAQLTGQPKPGDDSERFTYQTIGDDIIIYGGRQRGTMYGVYAFLENELGVRWYTHDCTVVPHLGTYTVKQWHHTERPTIAHRYVMYYNSSDNAAWAAHNRNNFHWSHHDNQYGGMEACLGAHTMAKYIPSGKLFERHPEYFALRSGKRHPEGQPCLSNPAVLRIVTDSVMRRIANNPQYLYYDVSQRDNQLFCECGKCRLIERRYGNTHSGIMLWFVNQVAEAVAKQYPDKQLCTFAYQYTRQAPSNIQPHSNVTVRLCDIECCFAHPIGKCSKNSSFMSDLTAWSRLTDRLFIWDYVVNFRQYMAPYPNFDVLRQNIKTFATHGATTILEQGQRQSVGGEFAELKAWVLAHLLWNPDQDAERLAQDFIRGYYGTAAPYIEKYFQLCRQQVKASTHIYQNSKKHMTIYTDDFIRRSMSILNKAMDKCRDDITRERVEHVKAQILYTKVANNPVISRLDGTLQEFNEYIRHYKPHISENQSADKYMESLTIK